MTPKNRFERKGKRDQRGSLKDAHALQFKDAHALQFNVAQLLKHTGSDTRTYDIEAATIPTLNNEFTLSKPIDGQIKLIKTDKEIFVGGQLETEIVLPCVRCSKDMNTLVTLEIEETFSPTIDITTGVQLPPNEDTDEATLISEQHILDLAEVIRQALHLSQPSQVLCQTDCQGLCQLCGANLNIEDCDCSDEEIDSRWADLLNMKKNIS